MLVAKHMGAAQVLLTGKLAFQNSASCYLITMYGWVYITYLYLSTTREYKTNHFLLNEDISDLVPKLLR